MGILSWVSNSEIMCMLLSEAPADDEIADEPGWEYSLPSLLPQKRGEEEELDIFFQALSLNVYVQIPRV